MISFSASDVAAFVERIQAEMKKNFIVVVDKWLNRALKQVFLGFEDVEIPIQGISIEIIGKNFILQE